MKRAGSRCSSSAMDVARLAEALCKNSEYKTSVVFFYNIHVRLVMLFYVNTNKQEFSSITLVKMGGG